jgi:predicted permease
MRVLADVIERLRALVFRNRVEREMAEELRFHVERDTEERVRQGATPATARREALLAFGGVEPWKEKVRDARGVRHLENLGSDLRYALRGLRRNPGFTVTVVLTLGLGIGANAAMFSVIDRLMFRPFPHLRDPGTVHRVYLQATYQGRTSTNTTFPYTRYLDLKDATNRFAEYAAVSEWRFGVGGEGEDVRVRKVAGVSASFFGFFEGAPALGRYFGPAEDAAPMGALVAVIGHAFWRTSYASGAVVGRPLKVGQLTYTIVGVAPEGFVGTVGGGPPDVFVPITTVPANLGPWNAANYHTAYNWDWTGVLVRRRPGVGVDEASADLSSAYIQSRASARALNPRVLPDSLARPRAIAGPVKTAAGPDPGPESKVLLWVAGVAVVVLVIACASVANLMLARVIRRRREVTMRLALGVSRTRLGAQFVTESLVLALLGCLAGLLVAQWSGTAIRRLLLPEGSAFNLADDWRTIGVALGCAVLCTLLTAIAPVLVATRTDLAGVLNSGARAGHRQGSPLQVGLLVLQASLSVVLLVGAALFVRSFGNARAIPLGYDPGPVLEVISDFRGQATEDSTRAMARRRLLAEAQALPGVEHAAVINSGLFRTNTAELRVPGIDSVAALGRFNFQMATADYFRVMRMEVVRGRGLEAGDRLGAPLVAVVSEAMGQVLWPGRDPLGQCLHVGFGQSPNLEAAPCTTVVGIAANTVQQDLTEDPKYMYYLPIEQVAPGLTSTMLLRMAGGVTAPEVERVRRELTRAMPGDGFVVVRPLQEVVDDTSRSWRLGATLFVAFGGLAFLVAIVGLYGVISYNVAGRMHELGVRVALGAQSRSVVRLVVGQGVRLALAGVVIGLAIALVASRWVQPLLFQQSATDLSIYALVGLAMIAVALVASLAPALRAAKADPNSVLRAEGT